MRMARRFFPDEFDELRADHWVGLRPVSPDDCPMIGVSGVYENLYYNVGHGSRGVALSGGSGKMLADMMSGGKGKEGLDYRLFDPKRFNL